MCLRKPPVQSILFRYKKRKIILVDMFLFVIIILPDKTSILTTFRKCILSKKLRVFIVCVHIKKKSPANLKMFIYPNKCFLQFLFIQNIIDAVTGTVYCPDTSIQIQFLHLLQQIQDFFFSALCQCDLKHLCRAVHAGHIVSGFCHKTRQFSGPTSQIEHRSVPDSVFF